MEKFDQDPLPIEIKEVKEEIKSKWIGEMLAVKGLTIWEYDPATKRLGPAEILQSVLELNHDQAKKYLTPVSHKIIHREIVRKPEHLYFQALNRNSAMKKLTKLGVV